MKLISLHIENFGGLSGYNLAFEEGITVVAEPNGFGKTTLAEFIRAMFYGFPRKAKTLDKSLRQKYAPWNGGRCGGNLVFELDGNRYRLERSFGPTPKTDTFRLIDVKTGTVSNRFSDEIGLELFSLDSDSFERSTYMPQLRDAAGLSTNTIQAKLGDLVEDTNDINNFDKAMEMLRSRRSLLIPYRGSGGSVAQAHGQISALQQELQQIRNGQQELERCRQEMEELDQRTEILDRELARVREQILRWSAEAAAAGAKQQLQRLERQEQDILRQMEDLKKSMLDQAEINRLKEANRTLLRIKHEQQLLEKEENGDRLAELTAVFADGVPEDTQLADCSRDLDGILRLEQENELLQARIAEIPAPKKASPISAFALLGLGIIAVAAGIVLLVYQQALIGGIVLGIGVLGLIAAAFLGMRLMISRELSGMERTAPEQQRIQGNLEEIRMLQQRTRSFARRYSGLEATGDALEEIRRAKAEYLDLRMKQAARQKRRRELEIQAAQQEEMLTASLGTGDYEQGLLQRQFVGEQHLKAQERLAVLSREKNVFRAENRELLEMETGAMDADLTALQRQEQQILSELRQMSDRSLRLQQISADLQEQFRRIPDMEQELVQWQNRKEEGQRNARLLDDTMAFLEQAREKLTTSYLGPIRESFLRYLKMLDFDIREQVFISPDLQVQLERQGQARELGYFSAGQTDMVMLCMRFALVDALFTKEKPFVILDDPFINLDDSHTKQALTLLQKLAGDRQILYLTCNTSRTF